MPEQGWNSTAPRVFDIQNSLSFVADVVPLRFPTARSLKMRSLLALLAITSTTALTRPKRQASLARRAGGSGRLVDTALDVPHGGAGGLGKFATLWRETDGIILVYFWSAPYVLAAISPFGVWRNFFGSILRNVYLTDAKGERGYIRWEILWIMGSLANTYVLMSEAAQPVRLRRGALIWAITFTLAFLKFAAEKQKGWLSDGGYVSAQVVHAVVAL